MYAVQNGADGMKLYFFGTIRNGMESRTPVNVAGVFPLFRGFQAAGMGRGFGAVCRIRDARAG